MSENEEIRENAYAEFPAEEATPEDEIPIEPTEDNDDAEIYELDCESLLDSPAFRIGAAIGGLVLLGGGIALAVCLHKKKQERQSECRLAAFREAAMDRLKNIRIPYVH